MTIATPQAKLEVGAGLILYAYLPLSAHVPSTIEVYYASLLLDGTYGQFGMHVEPRVRDTKLRPFYTSNVWIEEAYAYVDWEPFFIKVGKAYSRLGLFWDNSFYGNLQSFDGLKLDPDIGISAEGRVGARFGLAFWGQFFIDGRTNISLDGRDTISIPGASRRNMAVAQIEPFVRLGSQSIVKLGLSAEYFRAELPEEEHDVFRIAEHVVIVVEGWQAWAEFLLQHGQSVTDFPYPGTPATATTPAIPGRASAHNRYLLLGTEYTFHGLVGRYNFSLARYDDVDVTEWIHEPGLGFLINSQFSALAEYVLWKRSAPEGETTFDSSVNLTLNAHF